MSIEEKLAIHEMIAQYSYTYIRTTARTQQALPNCSSRTAYSRSLSAARPAPQSDSSRERRFALRVTSRCRPHRLLTRGRGFSPASTRSCGGFRAAGSPATARSPGRWGRPGVRAPSAGRSGHAQTMCPGTAWSTRRERSAGGRPVDTSVSGCSCGERACASPATGGSTSRSSAGRASRVRASPSPGTDRAGPVRGPKCRCRSSTMKAIRSR